MTTSIERLALDQSGTLRSFYDGCRDIIRGKLTGDFLTKSILSQKDPTTCLLISGHTAESQNLLQMIEIDRELRVSIYLKMISARGIASLIDYSMPIDKDTRFLYFHHKSHTESCDDSFKLSPIKSLSKTSATHIVTEISWGMNMIIVLQLPSSEAIKIDSILDKIPYSLTDDKKAIDLNSDEKDLCDQIISTTVYSNIYELTKLTKLEDVYQKVLKLKKNRNEHQRLNYTLCPLYPQFTGDNQKFHEINSSTVENLEIHLLQQFSELKMLRYHLHLDLPELLKGQLQEQLKDAHKELLRINKMHEEQLQQICELVVSLRKEMDVQNSIDKLMHLYAQTTINDAIRRLINILKKLESKGKFIGSLQNDGFEYTDVAELSIKQGYSEKLVKDILRENNAHKAIICSTDQLRRTNKDDWNKKHAELKEEHNNDSHLNLVYADFTYSTYTLTKMIIIAPTEITTNNNQSTSPISQSNAERQTHPLSLSRSSSSSINGCINILLLGESGVGKSTFINAFANYLRFQTLDEAEKGKPIVIIPVSYIMTINDNFDERIIKFGEIDPNENHNDFGQSVTQQCKSYVFDIYNEKKLRIIDTPGFGDTRGDEQDDLNMEEIFSFLNHFTYLNGVCLLFKPEVVELNRYFRSCCTQLFEYFGKNIRDHLIFCFTNARSTFFAPGNTRPLLKTFFESFPIKKIPFERRNTFSFDSESFRYLVAVQDLMKFEQSQRGEFEQSWSKSVGESKRFRDYLIDRPPYRKNAEWRSIKDAQFQISYMIRPLVEGVRNILRNMLLHNPKSSIILRATHTKPSSMICYTCNRKNLREFGPFRILTDHLHRSSEICPSTEQKPTEYRLSYEFFNNQVDESFNNSKEQLRYLYETCAKFSCFLTDHSPIPQDDPFLTSINRMINEEQYICTSETSCDLNKTLIEKLKRLKTKYEEYLNTIKSSREEWTLSKIYDSIQSMYDIQMVKIQLDAIREYQRRVVENNQHVV